MTKRRGLKEGSIWMEGKSWRAAVSIQGRRLTRSFATKAECKFWIRETQDQIRKGMTYDASGINLGEFIQDWLEVHKKRLAPNTAVRYEQLVRDYIIPQLGKIKLRDLKLDRVEAHYQSLLKHGLSHRSIRFVHAILHRSLNDGIRRGYVGYNATQDAILPKSDAKEMAILDEDEALRFLISVQGSRYEAFYHMAIKTGMRKGELLALKWSDLDWRRGIIRVQRQIQRVHGQGLIIRPPKTRSGIRSIQLGEQMLDVLRSHLKRQQGEKEIAGDQWKDHDLIFTSTVGTHIGGSNILKDFKKQLEKANVKKIRFHDLRHTAASLMLNNGVPVLVVSKIIGHSKTSTTLDIYGHLIPVMQEEAARIMDELITPVKVELGENMNLNIQK